MDDSKQLLFDMNGRLPALKYTLPMALQHLVAMIVGCVTPAIIISSIAGLNNSMRILLIQSSLVCAALSTLLQLFGITRFCGARLPLIMGVSFAYLATMQDIASTTGIDTIFGAQIIGGTIAIVIGIFAKQLQRLFPPLITGTVVFTIGLSLYPTAITYMAGGSASASFGSWQNWTVAIFTLICVTTLNHFDKGMLKLASILLGIAAGYIFSAFFGMVDLSAVKDAGIFHWSGIDAALTPGLADVCKEAIDIAKEMGLTVSYDINYRKNLWNYGKSAQEVLRPLMTSSDIMFGSEGEYALLMGLKAPGFKATRNGEAYDTAAYEAFCKEISRQVPDCKYIYIALRNVISSAHHTFAGVLYSHGTMKHTRVFDIDEVIDCVGVGDAFCGAMLYAQHAFEDEQKRVDFSTAASVLKNTIAGDYNMVKVAEVEGLLAKQESGEVAR